MLLPQPCFKPNLECFQLSSLRPNTLLETFAFTYLVSLSLSTCFSLAFLFSSSCKSPSVRAAFLTQELSHPKHYIVNNHFQLTNLWIPSKRPISKGILILRFFRRSLLRRICPLETFLIASPSRFRFLACFHLNFINNSNLSFVCLCKNP